MEHAIYIKLGTHICNNVQNNLKSITSDNQGFVRAKTTWLPHKIIKYCLKVISQRNLLNTQNVIQNVSNVIKSISKSVSLLKTTVA